jgi:nucleotide-binding universal stress UspA family protein
LLYVASVLQTITGVSPRSNLLNWQPNNSKVEKMHPGPINNVRIESVFHPSDFSEASEIAFVHALKIALVAKAQLSMMHVSANASAEWQDFPGVRETLQRWKLIPEGSSRSAVAQLGINVQKVLVAGKDPVQACLAHLSLHRADLIVLAVRQHKGRMRWLEKSVGEPISRGSGQMTLFIPHGVDGFIARGDGSVRLKRILIPVTAKPRPQPAIEAVARIIRNLQLPDGAVTLLHAGRESEMPAVKLPNDTGWTWQRAARVGEPEDVILQASEEFGPDLIVMTTDGPDGFLDGLRGSTSERVLRKARCPVANLPVGSMLG